MSDDLCDRLTALSRSEHSDLSVAAEAVEEIGRLRAALAALADRFLAMSRAADEIREMASSIGQRHSMHEAAGRSDALRDATIIVRVEAERLLAGNGKG